MDLYVISMDKNVSNERVLQFMEDYNLHYPLVSGIDGAGKQVFTDFKIPYTPALILIAPDHTIVEQAIPYNQTSQGIIEVLETYNLSVSAVNDDLSTVKTDFTFFPNPVENQLNIRTSINENIKQIKIYQLTGQEILSKSYSNTSVENTLDVSFLNKGIYLLSVEFSHGQRIAKTFIKQ